MRKPDAFERVSAAEILRHRRHLTSEQIQLLRRGEFEAVARSLRLTQWVMLWVVLGLIVVGLAAYDVFHLGPSDLWTVLVLGALLGLFDAYQYIQARRTAEIVHLLMEERKRLAGGDPDRGQSLRFGV